MNEESDRLKALRNDLAVCERMLKVISDQRDQQNLLDQADLLRADIKRLADWEKDQANMHHSTFGDFGTPCGGAT